jgi:tetratricopeptide (TPR) repeat protein
MKYTATIDSFLDGKLEGEELVHFEKELLNNPKLAFWVERYKMLNEYMFEQSRKMKIRKELLNSSDTNDLEYIEPEELKKSVEIFLSEKDKTETKDVTELKIQLETIHNHHIMKNNMVIKANRSIWLKIAAAALVLFIIALGTFFMLNKKNYTTDQLYQAYYQPYKRNIYNRLTQNDPKNLFLQALGEYENGKYNEALVFFEKVPASDVSYTASCFFSGVALMETAKYEKAIDAFKHASGDTVLYKYTDWYIGLCYLKLKQRDNATLYFEKIVKTNGFYKDLAEDLLKKI